MSTKIVFKLIGITFVFFGEALGTGPIAPCTLDFNDNGVVDAADLHIQMQTWQLSSPSSPFDLDQNNVVNTLDAVLLSNHLDTQCIQSTLFPSDFYPSGPRPRLWLTPSRASMLNDAKQADDATYQRFVGQTDDVLVNQPWNGVQNYIGHLALMYRLSGNEAYADRAFLFMDQTPSQPQPGNDAAHGGYVNLALGFDWLYDHPLMTPTRKIGYVDKMIAWSDYVWEHINGNGLFVNGSDTDLVIMTGAAHLMMGCAIFGEDARSVDLLNRAWWLWVRGMGIDDPGTVLDFRPQPIRQWIRDAIGGHFFTGWSYFMSTDGFGLSWYWTTLATACGYDIGIQEPQLAGFWSGVIRTMLDLTDPPRLHVHHTGDWEDPNTLATQAFVHGTIAQAAHHASQAGDLYAAQLAKGYGQAVVSPHDSLFEEFFFIDLNRAPIDPYQAALDPVKLSQGTDRLFFRSHWDIESVWGMFSGEGGQPADHQAADTGHFMIYRHNDFLTKGCRIYGQPDMGTVFNNLSIENGLSHGSPRMAGFEKRASMSRSLIQLSNPTFAYAMVEADGQWNQDPLEWDPWLRVISYRRHFFWSGDYVVVFDRVRTIDDGDVVYKLRAMAPPALNGTVISQLSQNGEHRLLHRTLEPTNPSFLLIDETAAWDGVYQQYEVALSERRWQYQISSIPSSSVNFLNVMQMGPSSLNSLDDIDHLSDGATSGVRIGDWLIHFAREELLRDQVTYTAPGPSVLNHLVCDMEPGIYDVWTNGSVQTTKTVDGDSHCLYFQTSTQPVSVLLTGVTADMTP